MIILTIRFSGNIPSKFHLLRRFGTKSDGAVKLLYVVYKVKHIYSAVCYRYDNATGCTFNSVYNVEWCGLKCDM